MAGVGVDYGMSMLNWSLLGAPATAPAALFLGLARSVPNSTNGSEISTAGYARQTIAFSSAASPGNTVGNSVSAFFSLGTNVTVIIRGWQIWDSSAGGNMVYFGTCTPVSWLTGTAGEITVAVGAMKIGMI